ncbi:MAG TPA: condensation domain-containing protein, partial [Solirubrobacteraceae bacterium]
LWSSVLQRPAIDPDENFIDAGGNSLSGVALVARVRDSFGVPLKLSDVFAAPILGELAQVIDRLPASREAGTTDATPARHGSGPAPLSFAQERMWFLERLRPGSPAYHVPVAMRIVGPLDVAALQVALDGVVARHDSLRTTVAHVDGRAVQAIAPTGAVRLRTVDVDDEALRGLAEREALAPFDLERGPLIRCLLLRSSAEDHTLVIAIHHFAADDWSLGVLLDDLQVNYRAARRGGAPLPRLAWQPSDFAVQQRGRCNPQRLKELTSRERDRLSGAPTMIELPGDHPRPAIATSRGGRVHLRRSAEDRDRMAALGRDERASLFMVWLAGLAGFVSRITGRDDLLLGTISSGRTTLGSEPLVGFFTNTLVLRVRTVDDPSFAELVRRARRTLLEAEDGQELPFERLVEALRPDRDLRRHPLVQMVLALDLPLGERELDDGTVLRPREIDTHTARFDLTIRLRDDGADGLLLTLLYNADVFERATAERWAVQLARMVDEGVARPGTRVSELPLMDESERRTALEQARGERRAVPDERLHEVVEAWAQREPTAPAVIAGDRVIAYAELNRRANAL